MVNKATPDKIVQWVEEQSDFSLVEKNELTDELESYFVQRRSRIENETAKSKTICHACEGQGIFRNGIEVGEICLYCEGSGVQEIK